KRRIELTHLCRDARRNAGRIPAHAQCTRRALLRGGQRGGQSRMGPRDWRRTSRLRRMIIDIHGHYTTAPKALEVWRNRQIEGIGSPAEMPRASELSISDDDVRESIESN